MLKCTYDKIIHSSILCKWANLQNQQGIKYKMFQMCMYTLFSYMYVCSYITDVQVYSYE